MHQRVRRCAYVDMPSVYEHCHIEWSKELDDYPLTPAANIGTTSSGNRHWNHLRARGGRDTHRSGAASMQLAVR